MKHNANSIAGRLMSFFDANPDEELTIEMVATKLGRPLKQVRTRLIEMEKTGELEVVRVVRLPGQRRAQ